jgi:hypothetical protein
MDHDAAKAAEGREREDDADVGRLSGEETGSNSFRD